MPTFLKDEQSSDFIQYGHLLKSLSKEDVKQIDDRLEQEWKDVRANSTEFQREFLPSEPSAKFVSSKYIQHLKEQCKKRCHRESFASADATTTSATIASPLRALRPAQNASASSRSAPSRQISEPDAAIADMLSGNFSAPSEVQIVDYMGNAEILASGRIGQLCKYEATVVCYDPQLRELGKDKNEEG